MKRSPHESEQLRRLEPSKFSGEGFLGTDGRTIEQIIAEDARTLERLGIDRVGLADALETVFRRARNSLGADVEIYSGLTAAYHESRGKLPSPFRGDGYFEKGDVVMTDSRGRELVITHLSINLIRKHGFFQGAGSPFRIDPQQAAEMLRLIPEKHR